MGGTSIDDQEDRTCGTADEALEKFNEDSGIDTALLLDHEPHLASRGDRRDQAHAMASASGFDDRRFALLAPTTPRVMIRAHVGGIAKEDLRFFPLRKGFDLRVFLLEPLAQEGIPEDQSPCAAGKSGDLLWRCRPHALGSSRGA